MTYGFLSQVSLNQHNVFKGHPCCCIDQYFIHFLQSNNTSLYGYTTFIRSSIVGHLGFFYFLAITNNAAMNACIQVFVWAHVSISVGYIPRSGITGSFGNSMFSILRRCFSHFTFTPSVYEGSNFFMCPQDIVIICLCDNSYPSRCEQSHCDFVFP